MSSIIVELLKKIRGAIKKITGFKFHLLVLYVI